MVLASVDDRIVEWVAAHRFAPLNGFFTALGSVEKLGAIWVLLALGVGLLMLRGVWTAVVLAAATAVTTLAADGVSFVVKDLAHRARPFEAHPQIHPLYVVHSSSFPAGHAATAFAGATLLSYLAPRLAPLFVGLAAAIAFSRIYVGVHYPTDILAGALIGIVVGAAAIGVVLLVEKKWKLRAVTGRRQPIHAS